MPTYCASTPLPSFAEVKSLLSGFDVWPPLPITLPDLPTFNDVAMGGVSSLSIKLSHFAQEFLKSGILAVISTVVEAVASIIGGAVDDLLPKLPILNISFTELLTMGATNLYAAVASELSDALSPLWALLPSPIYVGISSLPLEVVEIVKTLVTDYLKSLVEVLTDLVNQAADILSIAGLPSLPTIPTLEEVTNAVRQYMLEEGKTVYEAIAELFPILPNPLFQQPLFGSISSTEIEFRNIMNIIMNEFVIIPLKMIADFAEDFLGVTLSPLCFFIPI